MLLPKDKINSIKAGCAIATGVLLICGGVFQLPGKTHQQAEMDTWMGQPAPPTPMSHPLSPLMGVGGTVLAVYGIWLFYKDGEYFEYEVNPDEVINNPVVMPQHKESPAPNYIPVDVPAVEVPRQAVALPPSAAPVVDARPKINHRDYAPAAPPVIPVKETHVEEESFEYTYEEDDEEDIIEDDSNCDDLADEAGVVGNIKDISLSLPLDKRKALVWELLRETFPLAIRLLKANPMKVYGVQRSGKSTFIKTLCIIRQIFLKHIIEANTPHATKNPNDPMRDYWYHFQDVYGYGGNYDAIGRRILAYYQRVKTPEKNPRTVVWDEYTNYVDRVKIYESKTKNEEYVGGLVKSFLSEVHKMGEWVIMITHGKTAAYAGGTKGTKDSQEEGYVIIKIIHKRNEYGEPMPAGRGLVSGLDVTDTGRPVTTKFKTPEWFRPETFIDLFPEVCSIKNKSSVAMPKIEHLDEPRIVSESENNTEIEEDFDPWRDE